MPKPKVIKITLSTSFLKNKYFLVILIILGAFLVGLTIAKFLPGSKTSDKSVTTNQPAPDLPDDESIAGFIQTQKLDFNNDQVQELLAIYHDQGDEYKIYKVFFAIFKLSGKNWQKVFEKEIEGISLYDNQGSATEKGKSYNSFQVVSLSGQNTNDVFLQTRAEGSGQFMGFFIYNLSPKGRIKELFVRGPIPHGQTGLEGNKIWLMEPIYGPDDPNCCPSSWKKTWWQYQGNQFVSLRTVEDKNYDRLFGMGFSQSQTISPPKQENQPVQQVSDEQQILAVARQYAENQSVLVSNFSLKILKQVGNYALVQVIPQNNEAEGASIVVEKIGTAWVAQEMGTIFPEWEARVPELFNW